MTSPSLLVMPLLMQHSILLAFFAAAAAHCSLRLSCLSTRTDPNSLSQSYSPGLIHLLASRVNHDALRSFSIPPDPCPLSFTASREPPCLPTVQQFGHSLFACINECTGREGRCTWILSDLACCPITTCCSAS